MNRLIKFSVAAALLGVIAVPAAQAVTTLETIPTSSTGVTLPSDATNGSGLIVEVFDAATGHSIFAWLGMTYAQLAPTSTAGLPPGGETLDFGVLNGTFVSPSGTGTAESWTSFVASEVAAGGSTASLQFAVFAGQNTTTNRAIEMTLASGTPTNGGVNNSLTKIATGITALTSSANCNSFNPCVALSSTDNGYLVSTLGTNFGGQTSAVVSGALGTDLDFFKFTSTSTGGLTLNNAATKLAYTNAGSPAFWTVGTNGDVEYVVPGSAPPVPLPAAAWLFGSGLLGLLGIGRRNRAAAA